MSLIEKAKDYVMTRRSFLGVTATAVAGAAAAVTLPGCGLQKVDSDKVAELANKEGKWITAACWHNCGGRCINKVYVVDGVVIRQKTDDTHPDSPDYPQQRACLRGRSQRKQCFGADRIKYPMKRKNWESGGGKKELRGKDEWVRISWDEALDIVATELKRIKETYGNKSIMAQTGSRLLNACGGRFGRWGTTSSGSWPQVTQNMQGISHMNSWGGEGSVNDRLDYRNAKLIVLWGANPAWSSLGNPTYNYLQAKKAGAKIITVNPMYSATQVSIGDEWIPVRPSTDTALLLGMAHYMITNNLHDQEFLDKYCVGFDAGHMPEGVDSKENFKDYVLGTYDGVPKTPEWASKICGTDPEVIRSFAKEIATTKPMAFTSAFSSSRTYMGEQFCQAFLTVGWMTGNVGISGGMVGDSAHANAGNGGAPMVKAGSNGVPPIPNPIFPDGYSWPGPPPEKTDWFGAVHDEAWDTVLTGKYTAGVRGKLDVDIHMLWHIGAESCLNQHPNINKGIEAHRKVDFVVTSGHFLTTNAKYSDLVLPATTEWEKYGGFLTGNREILIYYSQVTEPLFEAKDDIWMEKEIAKRIGIDPNRIDPIPAKQMVFNQVAGATVIKNDGSGFEPLVTITAQDIAELGVQGKPQQGRISYKEFKEKGIYQVERHPGDKFGYIAYKAFRDDPTGHPLKTKSGKFEIHCQSLSDKIKSYGFTTLPPIAKYTPPKEGYEETLKGEYPFQFFTPHYPRRSHSVLDNNIWTREAWGQELIMNASDAEKLGLKKGDIVKITSRNGAVIRPIYLTEGIVPGTVALGEGAWVEKDETTGIDKAGATNSLSGSNPTGQGVQPWNTGTVKIEKYNQPLDPDSKWPQRIVL